jgi:predicted nucleic acid-binding protein
MKQYVIDANVLFSGILSQKNLYKILFSEHTCYTPDFALLEIQKYREVILKKSKVNHKDLRAFTLFIFSKITVVPDYAISKEAYEEAVQLCQDIDPKDVFYVALTIELENTELLTRDKILYNGLLSKGFSRVKLFETFVNELNNEYHKSARARFFHLSW